ncbi:MAG: SDR family oxidoreductase [bacterium]|nr:SDR family oxidoreductase [bacterium]
MDLGLTGKSVLVTGSYRGTGEGIVRVLAREGATVLVHGFGDGEPDRVVDEIRASGGEAFGVVGDIREDDGAERVIREALKGRERVDVLVNSYGVAEGRGWLESPSEEWIDLYQKNVVSGVRLVKGFVSGMREAGWGRIIWISTIGSQRPAARTPAYYASKAALGNMTVSLMKELEGTGITVNTVSPGLIATREVKQSFLRMAKKRGWGEDWPSVQRKIASEVFPNPTGRIAEVEEVGDLIAFLSSERAGYLNGANLRIDGGAADAVN